MNVAKNWERILKWHAANTPQGTLTMSEGATRDQLDELEAVVGERLPDDFRESYELFNGTRGSILYYGPLNSLAEISTEWQKYRNWQVEDGYGIGPDWVPSDLRGPEIKPVFWNPLRLPITDYGGSDPVMLDLDPTSRGKRGQIIKHNHEVGPVSVIGKGICDWLGRMARELESGIHAYSERDWMVRPVEWD